MIIIILKKLNSVHNIITKAKFEHLPHEFNKANNDGDKKDKKNIDKLALV